jgi:hypothetical protein
LKFGDTIHDGSVTAAGEFVSPIAKRYPTKVSKHMHDEFYFTGHANRVVRVLVEVCMSWTASLIVKEYGFASSKTTGEEGFWGPGVSPANAARAVRRVRDTLRAKDWFKAVFGDDCEHGSCTDGVWTVEGAVTAG